MNTYQTRLSPNISCLLMIYAGIFAVWALVALPFSLAFPLIMLVALGLAAASQRQVIFQFVQAARFKHWMIVAATGLVFVNAVFVRLAHETLSWKVLLLSFVLLIPALVTHPPIHAARTEQTIRQGVRPVRWWAVLGGGVALWVLAESNGHLLGTDWLFLAWFEFLLLVGGIALTVWGMSGGFNLRFHWLGNRPLVNLTPSVPLSKVERGKVAGPGGEVEISMPSWRRDSEFLTVLLITLLALALRIFRLETAIHQLVDEMHFAFGVTQFWEGSDADTRLLLPFSTITAFPRLYVYVEHLIVSVLGSSLTSLRLLSAALGTLTIPALYMLARYLFDRTIALLAALMLAVLPTHVHFSRLALQVIADPFFGTVALAFLARALHTNHRRDFAIAGAALGMTQYFYEGGRLLFPPLVVAWLALIAVFYQRQFKGWLVMGFMALLVAFPVYYALAGEANNLVPRYESQRLPFDELLARWNNEAADGRHHFELAVEVYTNKQDGGWFYRGDTALILPYLVPFFLLGAACAVWHWRKPGGALPLLWLAGTSAGNMLLAAPDWYARYVVALPALALLVSLGLRYFATLLEILIPRLMESRRRVLAGACVVVLALMAYQAHYYFDDHLQRFGELNLFANELDDALFRARDLPPETQVFIIDNQFYPYMNVPIFRRFFHVPQTITIALPYDLPAQFYAQLPKDVPYAFFLDGEDKATPRLIQRYFFLEPPQTSPYNIHPDKQLWLYFAPARNP